MNIFDELYNILENPEKEKPGDFLARIIISLTIISIVLIILESIESLNKKYLKIFNIFEIILVSIFTIEYFSRMIIVRKKYPAKNYLFSLIKYIFSPMAIVDLIAILPFYLPMIFVFDLRFIRVLRLTRLFRVFKLNRYTYSFSIIGNVLKRKREDLFITSFVSFIILLFSSTLMFYVEHDLQPKAFSNILQTLWWVFFTLTSAGSNVVEPVSGVGKFMSAIIAIIGLTFIAIIIGIICSGFVEEVLEKKECPHCGKKINSKN